VPTRTSSRAGLELIAEMGYALGSSKLGGMVAGGGERAHPVGGEDYPRSLPELRGLLFYRLLEQAVTAAPTTYETIVWSRRGRWPQRKGHAEAAPAFTDPSAVHGEPSGRLEPSA